MEEESTAGLLARVARLGWASLGESREGRKLPAEALGQGAAVPLLVVGGVHGNEASSVSAVLDLADELAAGRVAAGGLVWVVPALNPDGIAREQKDSAAGVDLNRNFPARNFSAAHPPGYFPGPLPLSEPETRALAGLIDRARPRAVVAVHAPFACINFDGPAAGWANTVSAACGWPVQADIGYPTPGSLGSWLGVDRGLPVLTIELPPGPHASFRERARRALAAAVAAAPPGDDERASGSR